MILRLTILCLCCQVLSCNSDTPNRPVGNPLILRSSYLLDVREPSGLALDVTRSFLWTVGNHPQRIYRLSLEG